MAFGTGKIAVRLQARWQHTAFMTWSACLLLAFRPHIGRCQSGLVHLYIDAGATSPDYQFTDSAGNAWSGDTFYIGGGIEAFGDSIAQAANGTGNVYQTNRIGRQFQYSFIGLQPGASYAVSLLFCELYFTDPVARLFNVTFNGQQELLSDFSIFQAAGGKDIAYDASFTLVADPAGTLTFLFIALKDNAIVSGFEIKDAQPPAASPIRAPAGSSQRGAPVQAPVSALQQPSAAAPGQLQAQPPLAPLYTAPVLAPLQLLDQILVPALAPALVLTRLPPPLAQAPSPQTARPPVLAPAPIAALSGPPVPGHPQPPVLAPAPGASLSSSATAAPQPSSGFMLPPSPALAPNQAEPLKVFLAQSGSPSGVPLPAQAPQQGLPPAPALVPQAGPGSATPASAVSATDVNQSTASTVSSQVSTSIVTTTTIVTTQAPPTPASSGATTAALGTPQQSVNAENVSALAASIAAEEDAKYVHFTKGQVAGLIVGLWLGLIVVDTVTLVVAILAIKVRRAQESM